MTNKRMFQIALLKRNYTFDKLANEIDLSRQSMSYKVNNKRKFTETEINKIDSVLNLSIEEKEKIFFEH
nr:MAG TPA: Regulatory protein-modification, helix-turn-helix, transcriptional regulato, DNA [Caudoviricetes sp.]